MAEHRRLRAGVLPMLGTAALIAAPTAHAEPANEGGYNGAPTIVSGGPAPVMNGVPCLGGNLGVCTGFAQNQPRQSRPFSPVDHSPTVNR
jgi:hypothetical protein